MTKEWNPSLAYDEITAKILKISERRAIAQQQVKNAIGWVRE